MTGVDVTAQPEVIDALHTVETTSHFRAISAQIPADNLAVLAVSLDGSGRVAAAFGPAAAQRIGRETLRSLAHHVGARGTVAVGPSVSGVVVVDVTRSDIHELIADITQHLTGTVKDGGVAYFLESAVGVALPGDGITEDAVDVLGAAIAALHGARASRVHVAFARENSVGRLRDEVLLAAELANAVGEQFTLHYQPIVELDTLTVVGYESLLRWTVDGRIRPPAEFLDAAEETSLIVPIGRWGVAEAIAQLARWQVDTDTPPFMSVNFSSQQLHDRTLTAHVRDALRAAAVPASSLWVEITERDLIAADSPAAQTIRELDELGCVICVDDLGTGYSALRYMVDQPIRVAKIDRSLIDGIETDPTKRRIVETICQLSRTLSIDTVAEGVENHEQVVLLREVGFTHGQGFLFGRPQAAEDIDI